MRYLIAFIYILTFAPLVGQSLNEKITKLNNTKNYLQNSENLNYKSILNSVSQIKYLSDKLDRLFGSSENKIRNAFIRILDSEEQQKSVLSKIVREKSVGETIIVEGIVKDISSDNTTVSVILTNNVKCVLKNKSDIREANQNDKVLIKGKLDAHEGIYSVLKDCIFFKKRDLSPLYSQANKLLQNFINESIAIIDNELKATNELFISNLFKDAEQEFNANRYENALKLYINIRDINPQFPKIKEYILNSRLNLDYDEATKLINQNNFFKAYQLLEPLAFKHQFKNSNELYSKTLSDTYSKIINQSVNQNDIKGYISVFDTLKFKYQKYKEPLFDRLYEKWIAGFNEFAYKYFRGDFQNYFIIPEGSYYENSRSISVDAFLINPHQIESTTIKSYNITKGISYSKSFTISRSAVVLELANWLNLKPINDKQRAYVNCGGWKSLKEKDRFKDDKSKYVNDYNLANLNKYLCIPLDEVQNEEIKDKLGLKAETIFRKTNDYILAKKESAYASGRVKRYYQYIFKPFLVYYGSDEKYSDFKMPSLADTSLKLSRGGLNVGFSIGYVIGYGKDSDQTPKVVSFTTNYAIALHASFDDLESKDHILNTFNSTQFEFGLNYSSYFLTNYEVGIGYSLLAKEIKLTDKQNNTEIDYSTNNSALFVNMTLGKILFFNIKYYIPINKNNFGNNDEYQLGVGLAFPLWFGEMEIF